jgi:hypothetical protein
LQLAPLRSQSSRLVVPVLLLGEKSADTLSRVRWPVVEGALGFLFASNAPFFNPPTPLSVPAPTTQHQPVSDQP